MGSFLADCMSSLEQIRQQAAGSLVEQHAPFCHRRDEWEESSITAFVKALSQGDEQLMTALLKLGMEHWGKSGLSPEVQTEIWGPDTVLNVWLERWLNAKCFETGYTWKKKSWQSVWWMMRSSRFSDCCFLVQQHTVVLGRELDCVPLPPHYTGAKEGEGKQEIYVLLWHTLL